MSLPRSVLITATVKKFRDGLLKSGLDVFTTKDLLDLIGSHEQLRAIALSTQHRLRAVEEERARLQNQIELIARTR